MDSRQTRQYNNNTARSYYVDGNVVRKTAPARRREGELTRVERRARKNRDKARYMNFGYVVFLSVAVMITAITLLSYVKAQSELTISVKRVATLENQLNSMKVTNDENLDRINGAVNLEEIKRIAVEELGMTYAKEGQVVIIDSEGSDYVRQLGSL